MTPYSSRDLDIPKLRTAIKTLEVERRATKTPPAFADSHAYNPAWNAAWNSFWERRKFLTIRLTLLYAIRAHGRGLLHAQTTKRAGRNLGFGPHDVVTFDLQAKWIGDAWTEFKKEVRTEQAA